MSIWVRVSWSNPSRVARAWPILATLTTDPTARASSMRRKRTCVRGWTSGDFLFVRAAGRAGGGVLRDRTISSTHRAPGHGVGAGDGPAGLGRAGGAGLGARRELPG
ncbi:hypothetical protein, partial [Streptomyces sp. rh206]|uniref:hypothetical protein n=1 Tax=Streptomyces sp. rh206 TaxID=2034270 RepID=UPI001C54C6D4